MAKTLGRLRFMQIALQQAFGQWTDTDLDKAKAQWFDLMMAANTLGSQLRFKVEHKTATQDELIKGNRELDSLLTMKSHLFNAIQSEEKRLDDGRATPDETG